MAYNNTARDVPEQPDRRHVQLPAGRAVRDRGPGRSARRRRSRSADAARAGRSPARRAMDFFEHQDQARRAIDARCSALFARRVALVIGWSRSPWSVVVAVSPGGRRARRPTCAPSRPAGSRGTRRSVLGVAVGTLAVIGVGSAVQDRPAARRRRRGRRDARRHAWSTPDTTDPAERRLLNVVEEMAIASGVPVPPVYVLERGAGHQRLRRRLLARRRRGRRHPRRAASSSTRDELQGVIAPRVQPHPQRRHAAEHPPDGHALRHPRASAIIGRAILHGCAPRGRQQGRRRRIAARRRWRCMVIGYIGVFFGRLIKAARRRASASSWPTPRRCSSRATRRASPAR